MIIDLFNFMLYTLIAALGTVSQMKLYFVVQAVSKKNKFKRFPRNMRTLMLF